MRTTVIAPLTTLALTLATNTVAATITRITTTHFASQ
jgi:hypothetical protein